MHSCWQALEEAAQSGRGVGKAPGDFVPQAQLTGATDGVGPVYFAGCIFKAFPVAPISEQLPTLLLLASISIEIVLLVKIK